MKPLPISLTQFLGHPSLVQFNDYGEKWDNRTTTAMWVWILTKKTMRENKRLAAEYAKRIWKAQK